MKMKGFRKITNAMTGMGVLALLLAISIPKHCSAVTTEEQLKNWPSPMYQGEELKKVREWEKTWAGKTINKDNIDQVKEFLTEQFYGMYKNPQDWGADDIWFEIVPYRQILPTPGQIAATKKYAPTASFDPNPRKAYWVGEVGPNEFLMGWDKGDIAGYPFPFPKSGLEIAWNIELNSRGDTKSIHRDGVVVNARTRAERRAIQPWMRDYFTGRTDVPPIPKKPKNPKGLRQGYFLSIEEPIDVQGMRYMELRYLNVKKPEDVWIWFPLFRRIRRMGVVYKSDTIDGTDMGPDDEFGWNGHVNVHNWKIVGRKEMLLGRHTDTNKYTKKKGQALYSGLQLERTNTIVMEVYYKDPNGRYSKQLFYVDPEMWRCMQKVSWDRQGRPWRQFFYHTEIVKSKQGIVQPHCFEIYTCDLQRRHGAPVLDKIKEIGQTIPDRFWTIQNLQKLGY
jgi:hypothetical protein